MLDAYAPVVIAAVASVIGALVTIAASRPKVRADVSKTFNDMALQLVEPQKNRIAALEKKQAAMMCQIKKLEAENRALHKWAQLLFVQVVEGGGDPIPFTRSQQLAGEET